MRMRHLLIAFLAIVFGASSGCASGSAPVLPTETGTSYPIERVTGAIPTMVTPTVTATSLPSPQLKPGFTRSPTITPASPVDSHQVDEPMPTITRSSVTITPTLSPVVTLSVEEARRLILSNGGCQLPCWWGIHPGESRRNAFEALAAQLKDFSRNKLYETKGTFWVRVPDGEFQPSVYIEFGPLENDTVEWLGIRPGLDQREANGTYDLSAGDESLEFEVYFSRYMLSNTLSTYGQPDEILLGGDPDACFYTVALVYLSQGIFFAYTGNMCSTYRVCPAASKIEGIWAWEPGRYSSRQEVYASSVPIVLFGERFTGIEEKTGISLEEFYERFKDPAERGCLQSSAERWWGP